MDKKANPKPSRRNFLLAVGAGGVAAAAAAVRRKSPPPVASSTEARTGSASYRLTEHVRNYYRTAKI